MKATNIGELNLNDVLPFVYKTAKKVFKEQFTC